MGLAFKTLMMARLQEVTHPFQKYVKKAVSKFINASLGQIKVQRGNICFVMPLVIMPCLFYDIFTLLQSLRWQYRSLPSFTPKATPMFYHSQC
jgi:hypothetical protein